MNLVLGYIICAGDGMQASSISNIRSVWKKFRELASFNIEEILSE